MKVGIKRADIKIVAFIFSIFLFIASLALPCYCIPHDECYYGAAALCYGALSLGMNKAGFTWLANPLLVIGWAINKRFPWLSFLFFFTAFVLSSLAPFLLADNGLINGLQQSRIGYWLWWMSSLIMVIDQVLLVVRNRHQKNAAA